VTAWVYDDGGRAAAGYKGHAGDCTVRAFSIASGLPYRDVYDAVNELGRAERRVRQARYDRKGMAVRARGSSAREGTSKEVTRQLAEALGWPWTPTMFIGQGCKVHLRADELPGGALVAQTSKHVVAVIDGVIHDTYDPSRGGTRCVYGYWSAP